MTTTEAKLRECLENLSDQLDSGLRKVDDGSLEAIPTRAVRHWLDQINRVLAETEPPKTED